MKVRFNQTLREVREIVAGVGGWQRISDVAIFFQGPAGGGRERKLLKYKCGNNAYPETKRHEVNKIANGEPA